MNKFKKYLKRISKKYLKRISIVIPLIAIIFSFTFCVGAIGGNNNGVLVYNITSKVSDTVTASPSTTSGFNIYQYSDTNQVGFVIPDGTNRFTSSKYRYCTFRLQNTNSQSYIVTIRFVAYYGQSGLTSPFGFDGSPDAWVNTTRYGSYSSFDYSLTDKTGSYTLYGGQFTFGLYAGSDVSVVLLAGLQESSANALYFNVDIEATPYNSNSDIIDSFYDSTQDIIADQQQNTQDIIDNQNENADRIAGIFEDDSYNDFGSTQGAVDDYHTSEDQIKDAANDNLDNVRSDLFDTNLLNPNVNSPIKGFKVMSHLVDYVTEIPSLGFIFKISISFGIIAFVLGLVITIFKRR